MYIQSVYNATFFTDFSSLLVMEASDADTDFKTIKETSITKQIGDDHHCLVHSMVYPMLVLAARFID